MDMTQVWLTLVVLAAVLALLIFSTLGADAVLLGGLIAALLLGLVDTPTALSGFANEGMLTVAALFVVAAGVRQTGAISKLAGALLGRSSSTRVALLRLTFPVAAMSALLNNTPIVAALVPGLSDWARRNQRSASLFLMPLSYATILGGTITVIGTSTNLVVTGLIEKRVGSVPGLVPIGIFDIAPIGIPLALMGCVALVLLAPKLLPERRPAVSLEDDPRLYTSEFLVVAGSTLVGKSIEQAGLRHLPGAYLAELHRGKATLPAVEPTTVLDDGDRLVFVGPRESVVDLQRIPGLIAAPVRAVDQAMSRDRCLVEAVVAPSNPLCGVSIREGDFRGQFQAVVVAAARDGHRIQGRLGDIVLQPGDVLLLDTSPSWVDNHRNRRDFYLVSEVADSARYRSNRMVAALTILLVMVLAAATELLTMFHASLAAAAAMVISGCLSGAEARRSIELPVLVAIAAAFGLGESIRHSGLDQWLAQTLVAWGASGPYSAMIAMYIATMVLTELVTNNAAAALMFPFALSLASQLGVSPMPFCVAVMFAASASFATPIGYQTNLMVYGPGGYRFSDFFRLGIPLQVAAAIVTCSIIPFVFPF